VPGDQRERDGELEAVAAAHPYDLEIIAGGRECLAQRRRAQRVRQREHARLERRERCVADPEGGVVGARGTVPAHLRQARAAIADFRLDLEILCAGAQGALEVVARRARDDGADVALRPRSRRPPARDEPHRRGDLAAAEAHPAAASDQQALVHVEMPDVA
jgi:hypothetical protein